MRHGFTLLEIAIAISIMALITGGILGTKALLRASELNNVVTEYQRYRTAHNAFQERFNTLPGDITNATSYWTAQVGDCITTGAADGTTCNGNGDESIYPSATSNEYFRYWQHLLLAELITGKYNGITGGATTYSAVPGTNTPTSKLSQAGWSIFNFKQWAIDQSLVSDAGRINGEIGKDSSTLFEGYYGTALVLGKAVTDSYTSDVVMAADEMWEIDKKIDDTLPGTGTIRAFESQSNCYTSTPQGPSTGTAIARTTAYAVRNTGNNCSLIGDLML